MGKFIRNLVSSTENSIRQKLNMPLKEVHIHGGIINRASFKAGDIFINYNNSVSHNQFKLPQVLSGNIQYSSFTHGGLIISDTHLMHAGARAEEECPLIIDEISSQFNAKREYRIFRPKNPELAEEMVEVALDLYWNKFIPFAGLVTPQVSNLMTTLTQTLASKGSMSLFRFFGKGRENKTLADMRAEYKSMINADPLLQQKITAEREKIFQEMAEHITHGRIVMNDVELRVYLDEAMENYLATLTPTKKNAKKFICTQFVTWVVQVAAGVLNERDPSRFKYNAIDILNIRDTKATPARLTELLKRSEHFIEFKSEESYQNPINHASKIFGVAPTPMEVMGNNKRKQNILQISENKSLDAYEKKEKAAKSLNSAKQNASTANMKVILAERAVIEEERNAKIAREQELARLQQQIERITASIPAMEANIPTMEAQLTANIARVNAALEREKERAEAGIREAETKEAAIKSQMRQITTAKINTELERAMAEANVIKAENEIVAIGIARKRIQISPQAAKAELEEARNNLIVAKAKLKEATKASEIAKANAETEAERMQNTLQLVQADKRTAMFGGTATRDLQQLQLIEKPAVRKAKADLEKAKVDLEKAKNQTENIINSDIRTEKLVRAKADLEKAKADLEKAKFTQKLAVIEADIAREKSDTLYDELVKARARFPHISGRELSYKAITPTTLPGQVWA